MMSDGADKTWVTGPRCLRRSCFAWHGDRCIALCDNDFGDRDCPFYKSREQRAQELCDAGAKRRDISPSTAPSTHRMRAYLQNAGLFNKKGNSGRNQQPRVGE